MTQYPDETTRRHLLALTKAGHIKQASTKDQVAEVVENYKLIMEATEAAKRPCSHGHWLNYDDGRRCLICGEKLP